MTSIAVRQCPPPPPQQPNWTWRALFSYSCTLPPSMMSVNCSTCPTSTHAYSSPGTVLQKIPPTIMQLSDVPQIGYLYSQIGRYVHALVSLV